MNKKDLIFFAKRMSFLMRAGVPILESLQILAEQSQGKSAKLIFESLVEDVANGNFLSTAMNKYQTIFGDFAINIIRVGENSGLLSENFKYLADELQKKQALKKKVVAALFYPIFIVLATLGMVTLLTLVVFPKVLPIFSSINVPLPLPTKILIVVSRFLISFGWLVMLLLIFGIITLIYFLRNPKFKKLTQQFLLTLPVAGRISLSYHLSNFCRTMGLLLKGDTRIDEAIATTASATENLVYKRQFEKATEAVKRGQPMSGYLNHYPKYFPKIIVFMLSIGETTGNLSETFLYLAEMYEQDVDDLTKNLSSMIEPVLMIFMGAMVGFVAISIITPIYSITQKLTK